jgi:potassium channel LctB
MKYSYEGSGKKKKNLKKTLAQLKGHQKKVQNSKVMISRIRGKTREVPGNVVKNLVDNMSFKGIFLAWISVILVFGLVYFFLGAASPENGLAGMGEPGAESLMNSIYFSFITATSTGFGDITPLGLSRLITIFEVIAGLTMFGILISKLVSFKQEVIVSEIYEISFGEKVNRLRSGLYLFRSDIDNIMEKLMRGKLTKVKINSLWSSFNSLIETLVDIRGVLCSPQKKGDYLKGVEDFQRELVLNSIRLSMNKANDLIKLLDSRKSLWRTDRNVASLKAVLTLADEIADFHETFALSSKVHKRMEQIIAVRNDIGNRVRG